MESEVPGSIPLRKSFLFVTLFFILAGSSLAVYATILTFKLTVSGIIDPSGCSFNDWLSCDTVLSTNSAIMLGVPASWWGFLFYLWAFFAVILAIINSKKPFGRSTAEAVLFISVISILITFFKIYQLITLGVICPVCVGMYICNFFIFLFLMKSQRVSFKNILSFEINYLKSIFTKKNAEQHSTHPLRFGVIFIWLFSMGYLGIIYYENTVIEPSLPNVKLLLNEHFKQKPVVINTEGAPVAGTPQAKVKIIEFSDFECPSCKLLSANMNAVLLEYKNDVGIYFMNFPLDKSINENLKTEMHKNAGLAALAGICAAEQGDFWNYQSELFENQTKFTREFFINLAVKHGLNIDKFISCMDSEATKQKVIRDIQEGSKNNITGTPTLYINGRKVKYWNSPSVLKGIIEEELSMMNKK